MKNHFILFSILVLLLGLTSCQDENENENLSTLEINESKTFDIASEFKWNNVLITVSAGETYNIVSSGTWKDLRTVTDADGYDDPVLDAFSFLKRNQDASWFELVAAIDESDMYVVGSNAYITFNESGSLSFFANDADAFYGNNMGSITTTITRID